MQWSRKADDIGAKVALALASYPGDHSKLVEWVYRTTEHLTEGRNEKRLSDDYLRFAQGVLTAAFQQDYLCRPSWYFAILASAHLRTDQDFAEKCVSLAEDVRRIEDEELLARRFRQKHVASKPRNADHEQIAAYWESQRKRSLSKGDSPPRR